LLGLLIDILESFIHSCLSSSHLGLDFLYCFFMSIIDGLWFWRSLSVHNLSIGNLGIDSGNSHIESLLHGLSFDLCLFDSCDVFSMLINGWVFELILGSLFGLRKLLENWWFRCLR
jgi:hypothetical protein